jgi:hypothetical protein
VILYHEKEGIQGHFFNFLGRQTELWGGIQCKEDDENIEKKERV